MFFINTQFTRLRLLESKRIKAKYKPTKVYLEQLQRICQDGN